MKTLPMLVVVTLGLAVGTASAAPTQITLLHVNDTHSHLAAWGPKDANLDGTLGGLAKAAAVIAGEKARDPHALFVHGGDFMNGDPFFNEYLGVPELQLLESLGLDVLVPGNHEFQFGPDFYAGVLSATWPAGGGVSIVGTNLDLAGYPALGTWISPTVVKDAGGVKVGFFGLTTPFDPLEQPAPVVIRSDLDAVAATAVAQLRAQGAEVVVCLAHLGMDLSRQLAASVPGIDVIVNAHDHVALAQPVQIARPQGGTTFIVSAGSYYRFVGRLRLSVDGAQVSLVDYALVGVDAATPRLPAVQAVVGSLEVGIVARYGDLYHEPLAWADAPIPAESDPRHAKRDTAIGDLFTDAYRRWTGTDLAIEASGFLDEGLPQGTIVGADLFRSMSYGLPQLDPAAGRYIVRPFRLATFRITGAQLLAGLEIALATPGGLFPQVSGVRFDYDSTRPAGQKILVGTVHIGGHRLVPDKLYTATANEGLLLFLPALGVQIQDVTVLPDSAQAAVRELVELRGVLEPATSGRIRDVAATCHSAPSASVGAVAR